MHAPKIYIKLTSHLYNLRIAGSQGAKCRMVATHYICVCVHMAGARTYACILYHFRYQVADPTKKQLGLTFGHAIYAAIMTRTENENSEVAGTATVRKQRKMEMKMEQRNPARTLFIKFRAALVMLSDTNKARKALAAIGNFGLFSN